MLPTQEILEKITFLYRHTVAKADDASRSPSREKYMLNPVMHWEDVKAFEAANCPRLPEEIREFVTAIGNGGVGPFSGLGKRPRWGDFTYPFKPFDFSQFVQVKKYDASEYESYRREQTHMIISSGGTYNPFIHPNWYQRGIKKRWGIELADDEYIKYGALNGCLPIGGDMGGIVYLIVNAAPEYEGRILLGPSLDGESKSNVHYQLHGSFGAFYREWLDKEIRKFAGAGYYNQNKAYLFNEKPLAEEREYATRVVFPGPASALAATSFFVKEKGVGSWLSTDDWDILARGVIRRSERYALHLPTVDREGNSLANYILAGFMLEAQRIGLDQRSRATGYCTLPDTDALQQKEIWILYTENEIPEDRLRHLARRVLETGDQNVVTIEVRGKVEVVR